ncbi:MAG: hypothetical protein AAF787_13845 [Chloroflexota bacterium]
MSTPIPGSTEFNLVICLAAFNRGTYWKLKSDLVGMPGTWGVVPEHKAKQIPDLLSGLYQGQDSGDDAEAWFSWMLDNDDNVVEFLEMHHGKQDRAFYMGLLNQPPYWAEVPDDNTTTG